MGPGPDPRPGYSGVAIEFLTATVLDPMSQYKNLPRLGTEPWMRWIQGIWELLASLCLLTPRLRWMGGILTTGAMSAAILSHMTRLGFSVMGDHGLLFCMAITTFTCGFTVLILHRHQIPFVTPLSNW